MRLTLSIIFLLLFGAARLPFEMALDRERQEAHFQKAELGLSLREKIGQMSFVAAFSGFRSLVAAFLWIEAHTAWEKTEWGRMAGLFDTVTTLQPRSLIYWDMAAWHMAWNASIAALEDPSQPSEALRIRAQRQYFDLGRDFLERGIKNNPDRYLLYERMGILLRDKYEDHCGAAVMFDKASQFPNARPYLRRFAAYELANCPGNEEKAYEKLMTLYNEGEDQHLPTLLSKIRDLEEKLGIPSEKHIPPAGKKTNNEE